LLRFSPRADKKLTIQIRTRFSHFKRNPRRYFCVEEQLQTIRALVVDRIRGVVQAAVLKHPLEICREHL
jgi:hypothetical protein